MSEWQPIETAPKDGTKLLLANEIMNAGIGFWDKHSKTWRGTGGEQPTHWMPLPNPPSGEGG